VDYYEVKFQTVLAMSISVERVRIGANGCEGKTYSNASHTSQGPPNGNCGVSGQMAGSRRLSCHSVFFSCAGKGLFK
jgi:hypothetical protein